MPTIKIDDLHPTGAELFSDSESYMNELGDGELDIYGGRTTPVCRSIVKSVVKVSKAGWEKSAAATKAAWRNKGKVSRFISGGTAWEVSTQLSNPFNSF
jgi:hypothetical protein